MPPAVAGASQARFHLWNSGKVEGKQAISGETPKRVLALLWRVCNEAKVNDLVEVTPCAGVRVNEAPEATQQTLCFLTLEEIDRLLSSPRRPERKRWIVAL